MGINMYSRVLKVTWASRGSKLVRHSSYLQNLKSQQFKRDRTGQCKSLHTGYTECSNRNLTTPVFCKANDFSGKVAIIDDDGKHTYCDIMQRALALSKQLKEIDTGFHTEGDTPARVCFLCPNDVSYVVAQWASWMAGGVAVPLCTSHPASELKYFMEDSDCKVVVATEEMYGKIEDVVKELDKPMVVLNKTDYHTGGEIDSSLLNVRQDQWKQMVVKDEFRSKPAMIIYTSGTTGRPKGVVHTHGSLTTMMDDMTESWEWKPSDVILHTLPLHHVHGIVNVLMTPMYNGATCILLPKFDAEKVWSKLTKEVNMFMAVPTIYAKLIDYYEKHYEQPGKTDIMRDLREACEKNVRLMVSGSAALPEPVMKRWEEITGHKLLERYGMTEIGMALTNPLKGPRIPGSVGSPFPSVEVAIAKAVDGSETGYDIIARGNHNKTNIKPGFEGESGELLVRGPNMFFNYWKRPESTRETFTSDGWFKTGDTVCYTDGVYRIMGRTSVDIIKSGGYKISALDIERHLLAHSDIVEVAILGLPDPVFGQRIAAVVVLSEGRSLSLEDLGTWCIDRIPKYQIPRVLKILDAIPRNAMGKVNKKELVRQVFPNETKASSS